jgi:uncharacterized protein (DUF362 family)
MENVNTGQVALVDISKQANLTDAIAKAVKLSGFKFKKEINKIAIKTNTCYYWKSTTGETTDPKFIEAVIDYLRMGTNNLKISVVESDATAMRANHAFKALGYEKLAKKNVELINLSEQPLIDVPNNTNPLFEKIKIPKILTDVDLFISVPKLKLHSLVKITCALKNQFGCIPFQRKVVFHNHIHKTIAFINKLVSPDLFIVDGTIVNGKTPKKLDLVMASSDPVAVDMVAAKIAGLNGKRLKFIQESEKIGVGTTKFHCVGDKLEHFANEFPQKSFLSNFVRRTLLKSYAFYLNRFTLEGKIFKKQPTLGD